MVLVELSGHGTEVRVHVKKVPFVKELKETKMECAHSTPAIFLENKMLILFVAKCVYILCKVDSLIVFVAKFVKLKCYTISFFNMKPIVIAK